MFIAVLGPLQVIDDGAIVAVPSRQQRALLVALALRMGEHVPRDQLIDELWPRQLPSDPRNALQHYVARLRRAIGRTHLSADGNGYALAVPREDFDIARFELQAADGRARCETGDFALAADVLGDALSLWRGEPFGELPDAPEAVAARARLTEVRDQAVEDRFNALMHAGPSEGLVAEITEAVVRDPGRERRWALLMQALYRDGRQTEALAAYQQARRHLGDVHGLDPGPDLRELEGRILRHDPLLLGPTGRGRVGRRPLPPRTSFVGREATVGVLDDLLERSRLVTVRGPVGAGKTRLVLEWAARHTGEVAVVTLDKLEDGAPLPTTVAEATGIAEDPGAEVVDRLSSQLRDRNIVLVFDACDDAIAEVRDLVDVLLGDCPELRVICTTADTIGLADEAQLNLSGLDGPSDDPLAPAVALFVDRVKGRRPGFDPGSSERATIAAIVDALDRLPLAVELAAARAATMSVAEVLNSVGDGADLRTEQPALRRHSSLHAALDWTLDRLPDVAHDAIAALAHLPGPFLADTAVAVTNSSIDAIVPTLDDLAARGLLHISHTTVGTSFVVTPTTRQHLSERAPQAAHLAVTHYGRLAAQIDEGLRGHEQLAWMARCDLETDNLSAALHHAIETRPRDALTIAAGLARYWDWRGHVARAHATLTTVLNATDEHATSEAVIATGWAAFFTWECGEVERATSLAERAMSLADAVESVEARGVAAGVAALILRSSGHTQSAAVVMRTALESSLGPDSWYAAWLGTALAPAELDLGDDQAAARLARSSLDTFRRLGDLRGEGWALVTRAMVLEGRGIGADATDAATDALLLADGVDDVRTVAAATELLARVAHADGDLEHAAALFAAVDALQLRRGAPGTPSKDTNHLDRVLDLEDRLGHARFTAAWRYGSEAGAVALTGD